MKPPEFSPAPAAPIPDRVGALEMQAVKAHGWHTHVWETLEEHGGEIVDVDKRLTKAEVRVTMLVAVAAAMTP